jgi:hypothetical protein
MANLWRMKSSRRTPLLPMKPWTPTTITTITHSSSHKRRDTMRGKTHIQPLDVLMESIHKERLHAITLPLVDGKICTKMWSGSIPPLACSVPISVISIVLSIKMLTPINALEIRPLELQLILAFLVPDTWPRLLEIQLMPITTQIPNLLTVLLLLVLAGTCNFLSKEVASLGTMTAFTRTCSRIGLKWSMTATLTAKRQDLSSP